MSRHLFFCRLLAVRIGRRATQQQQTVRSSSSSDLLKYPTDLLVRASGSFSISYVCWSYKSRAKSRFGNDSLVEHRAKLGQQVMLRIAEIEKDKRETKSTELNYASSVSMRYCGFFFYLFYYYRRVDHRRSSVRWIFLGTGTIIDTILHGYGYTIEWLFNRTTCTEQFCQPTLA